jgi:hypothetical protein
MVDEPNHVLLSILTYGIKGKYSSQVQQVHRKLHFVSILPLCSIDGRGGYLALIA